MRNDSYYIRPFRTMVLRTALLLLGLGGCAGAQQGKTNITEPAVNRRIAPPQRTTRSEHFPDAKVAVDVYPTKATQLHADTIDEYDAAIATHFGLLTGALEKNNDARDRWIRLLVARYNDFPLYPWRPRDFHVADMKTMFVEAGLPQDIYPMVANIIEAEYRYYHTESSHAAKGLSARRSSVFAADGKKLADITALTRLTSPLIAAAPCHPYWSRGVTELKEVHARLKHLRLIERLSREDASQNADSEFDEDQFRFVDSQITSTFSDALRQMVESSDKDNWKITCVDTGLSTSTCAYNLPVDEMNKSIEEIADEHIIRAVIPTYDPRSGIPMYENTGTDSQSTMDCMRREVFAGNWIDDNQVDSYLVGLRTRRVAPDQLFVWVITGVEPAAPESILSGFVALVQKSGNQLLVRNTSPWQNGADAKAGVRSETFAGRPLWIEPTGSTGTGGGGDSIGERVWVASGTSLVIAAEYETEGYWVEFSEPEVMTSYESTVFVKDDALHVAYRENSECSDESGTLAEYNVTETIRFHLVDDLLLQDNAKKFEAFECTPEKHSGNDNWLVRPLAPPPDGQSDVPDTGTDATTDTASVVEPFEKQVSGSLSKEEIRLVIHSNIKDVKFCYEQGLEKNNTLTGRVAIKFMISGTGQVMMAAVANSTLNNAEVESCMIRKLKTWHFPQPDGGGVVIVTYPFQLIAPE